MALVDTVADGFRTALIDGARVVELGCGLGLPGLVSAALGGDVLATDLPEMLSAVSWNAQASGYPQHVWKVVGGRFAGGVPLLPAEGSKDELRIAHGALVEELELRGDTLSFRRLEGAGPDFGKVGVRRFGGTEMLVRTEELPRERSLPGMLRAAALPWSTEAAKAVLEDGEVDLVLCSDCVNEPLLGRTWVALADCMVTMCGLRTVILFSVQRRLEDGVDSFLAYLGKHLMVEKMSSRRVGGSEVLVFCARRPRQSEEFYMMLNDRTLEGDAEVAAAEAARKCRPRLLEPGDSK